MKYLKLFEDVSNEDDYYKKVSTSEYQVKFWGENPGNLAETEFRKNNWDKIPKDELKSITRLIKKKDKGNVCDLTKVGFLRIMHVGDPIRAWDGIGYEMKNPVKSICKIIKLKDEWYGIESTKSHEYFICDQFDGLLKCLEDFI